MNNFIGKQYVLSLFNYANLNMAATAVFTFIYPKLMGKITSKNDFHIRNQRKKSLPRLTYGYIFDH